MSAEPARTLFIELLGGLGDLLIALPAIHGIAASRPSHRHEVLTFPPNHTLLAHDPYVDAVHIAHRGGAYEAVRAALTTQRYDVVVCDTAYDGVDRLVRRAPAACKVANLWRGPPATQGVGERFVELLRADGLLDVLPSGAGRVYLTPAERGRAAARLAPLDSPRVALVIEAGMAIKRWPLDRYVAAGRALRHRLGASVLVVEGGDGAAARHVAYGIGAGARIWPRSSLRDLAAALSQTDLVIGPDTGPCRLAAAAGADVLTLFGPSWHGRYGQPGSHANLQGYPACPQRRVEDFTRQRCWHDGRCPLPVFDTCLEDIGVERVVRAAMARLQPSRREAPGVLEGSASPERSRPEAGPRAVAPAAGRGRSGQRSAPIGAGRGVKPRTLHAVPAGEDTALMFGDTNVVPWLRARRLLVVRADDIGDVLMTGPALRAIRETSPSVSLTLLASPAGAQAAALLPWIDDVISWRVLWQDLGKLPFSAARERALVERLRAGRFDGAVILTSFGQSPHPAAFAAWSAGIPLRAGASREQSPLLTHATAKGDITMHQVDRNLALVGSLGFRTRRDALEVRIPQGARTRARELLAARGLAPGAPYVLVSPWASAAARVYDPMRLARACRRIAAASGLGILLTGHARDMAGTALMAERIGRAAINLCGASGVGELAALVAGAELVVTNNTSVMHLADALARPAVVLFAGTELEAQWAPRHGPHVLLRKPTRCSPCYAFACPYDHECLDLSPDAVTGAALDLLGPAVGAGGTA